MTPKQRVLRRYACAKCMRGLDYGGWSVVKPDARGIWHTIGIGRTAARAWADVLRLMRGK